MRFTLKDYQDEAVLDVLKNLHKARKRWREDGDRHAFSLTAPTGSGKTVMAAAVLEALFFGDDRYAFDCDRGAVVIWFSDDPALNEQTRFRLMESSDRLRPTDIVVVESTFNRPKFSSGKVYLLNTQKLSKKSLLVRGYDASEDESFIPAMRPDLRSYTIWDTIRNTIEDSSLTLYLVLDEAHRGMGGGTIREKSTIVKRLINGERDVPGAPIVWGISATAERFNRAIEGMSGRGTLPAVCVSASRVQESGLIKDTIVVDIPDSNTGDFDTVLIRRAAQKLRVATELWSAYSEQQGTNEVVVPLLILQVPNKPNPKEIGRALDIISEEWPQLPAESVAHVLGEHKRLQFGLHCVPYIEPQRVQNDNWIRVLIAKEAISTGWDCPRAEVMISFRPALDQTYIAQMLGRMVRSPLARRIPGDDRLNTVQCLLPKFDKKTVEAVVGALRDGSGEAPPAGRVLINPIEVKPNPDISPEIWARFESLPSQTRPQRSAKPVARLTALAHELASDGLLPRAGGKAHAAMHDVLDKLVAERQQDFENLRAAIRTVDGRTIVADITGDDIRDLGFEAEADEVVIGDLYRRTARIIGAEIARTYTIVRANRSPVAVEDFDDALIEAREEVAALHRLDGLQAVIDAAARALSESWLGDYRDRIKELPHDRQDAYRQIIALSNTPQDVDLVRPTSCYEPTVARDKDGREARIATYDRHLLCDERGAYPVELGSWEAEVLETEVVRDGFSAWYRNPNRPGPDSLGIAYLDGDESRMMRPDFIFFAIQDGEVVADIVDPHGFHLADALPKLRGLARYAQSHSEVYRRITAVAGVGGKLRVLDLKAPIVRQAIEVAMSAEALYKGELATDYVK